MAGIKNLDPRQTDFLIRYMDPKSGTYANALQSALKAGYAPEYAQTITAKGVEWLEEAIGRRKRILNKAEIRLEELLDSKNEQIAADLVKHTTKTLGKKFYSESPNIVMPIQVNVNQDREEFK